MSEWKLVPEEPTGDGKPFTLKHNMQRQGAARMWEVTDRQVAGLNMAAEIYRAMLAAAPKPPAGLYEAREDGTARRVEVDVVGALKEARAELESLRGGETCEHDVGICWCEYFWRLDQIDTALRALTGNERHD